jgi:hypothetical protein
LDDSSGVALLRIFQISALNDIFFKPFVFYFKFKNIRVSPCRSSQVHGLGLSATTQLFSKLHFRGYSVPGSLDKKGERRFVNLLLAKR